MTAPWIDAALRRAAATAEASDLALDPVHGGGLVLRVRAGGVYRDLERAPAGAEAATMARLKALAGLPAYITDEAQDGRIDGKLFGWPGDLRIAFLPTVRGARAAVRLPALGTLPAPDALGLPAPVVAGLRAALRRPQGLILVCGPTGSGKTTTIHSFLAELAAQRSDRLCVAIEDPVERHLPGVVQVETRAPQGFGFAEALRATLRQDPDVLIIGEVRDPDTAAAAVRAALSGHTVVTTLHCGRAHEALPRLLDMGVSRDLLLPTIRAVLAQRLVRSRHAACGGAGCRDCHDGYRGRQVIADWCVPDHAERSAWAAGTAPPLAADMDRTAADLVAAGTTTFAEINRVIGD